MADHHKSRPSPRGISFLYEEGAYEEGAAHHNEQ